MHRPLEGVRVVEVATWTFVPAAGAVLADWGADVIKVEPPNGDPQRGLITTGIVPSDGSGTSQVNYMIEQPNRGKRSIALELTAPEGREVLMRLVESSDVFLTNYLPHVRAKLRIDIDDVRERNPSIVYARGSGQGPRGAEAGRGAFDSTAYWSRSGVSYLMTPPEVDHPIRQTPAFGDLAGGQTIAGGIAAALFHRERAGVGSVVDVSLLAMGLWVTSPDVVAASAFGADLVRRSPSRLESPNPLAGTYKTADGRFIMLTMLQSDRFWPDFCIHVGHPELILDPRFVSAKARGDNRRECIQLIDDIFATHTYEEWKRTLATLSGVWAPVQAPHELRADAQVVDNEYILEVGDEGRTFPLVANPVQFDVTAPDLRRAPELGEHTETLLLEIGYDWEQILELKAASVLP